jgi:type II secretory pathway component PulF
MNYFRYKVLNTSGGISSGVVKLPYQEVLSAISHLERDGALAIDVKKLGRFTSFWVSIGSRSLNRKLKRREQAEIFNNMSIMLRAGIALTTTLEEVAQGSDHPRLARDVNDMISRIQGGAAFSEAAGSYPYIFPKTALDLIKMGEETGKLDEMLKDAADHLTRMQQIVSDTKQALLYPAFVFTTMGIGIVFWFAFVVPKIVSLFQEMDVTLPAITVALITISDFVQSYLIHMIIGLIATIFVFSIARKTNYNFKKLTDAVFLKVPIVGTIIHASMLAFITEYFSLLINAGVDILKSIQILKNSVGNAVYSEKLEEVLGGLGRGEGIAVAFRNVRIFPAFVVRMINIGEVSGTLTGQLNYIAEEYRKRLSILVATIGKMIEPIVLIIAGVCFAVIIGGLFLPIYDLISRIGTG